MNTIDVRSLTKFYGDKPALDGVNFSACDGDFIGLLGANGAGKSTLIKCLSGVLTPSDGDAFFNQYSIVRSRTYCQLKVGYLPESPSGFEDLTATEFIRLSALSHGLSNDKQKKSVATVIEELQLEQYQACVWLISQRVYGKEFGLLKLWCTIPKFSSLTSRRMDWILFKRLRYGVISWKSREKKL